MADLTDPERDYLRHLWRCRKWFGDAETMACAEKFAKTDPFRLSRLPALLKAEIEKHAAKQIPSTAN